MNQSHQTKAQVAQQASTAKTAIGMEHKLLLRTSSTEKTRKATKTKATQKCKGTRHISTQQKHRHIIVQVKQEARRTTIQCQVTTRVSQQQVQGFKATTKLDMKTKIIKLTKIAKCCC
jgi:hypothetical protein